MKNKEKDKKLLSILKYLKLILILSTKLCHKKSCRATEYPFIYPLYKWLWGKKISDLNDTNLLQYQELIPKRQSSLRMAMICYAY